MTSKRIKKKKKTSKFVALLLLFKNREKELYPKTNDIQNTRRVLLRGSYLYKKRERERETKRERRWLLSFQSFLLVRKKKNSAAFHVTRKHNKQAKKKKNDKTNRRLTSSSQDGNTLHPFWRIHLHSQEKRILLFSSSSFEKRSGSVFSRRRF